MGPSGTERFLMVEVLKVSRQVAEILGPNFLNTKVERKLAERTGLYPTLVISSTY